MTARWNDRRLVKRVKPGDGRHVAESKVPALFPVPGGRIDVRTSEAGMRRAHFVADDGTEHRLEPDPRSAEGRRMRFARERPAGSGLMGAVSIVLLPCRTISPPSARAGSGASP
jgi:hypothetical protein